MEQNIQAIIDLVNANQHISAEEKATIINKLKETDKKIGIIEFKLDRTEKVKRTTAILLEETIEELEQKRKAVEAQNRELEIESSLEKVRTVAMGMRLRDDMMDICRVISEQLELLGIKEIRNVQTAIFYQEKGTYINYEHYTRHAKSLITEVDYTKDQLSLVFAEKMTKGADEVFTRRLEGKEVQDWYNFQKTTNVFLDSFLETATSLTYYWFSLGPVAIGVSSYVPLTEDNLNLFRRFRNVFGLAYQRYIDIEKAEAQAREAKIEAALERVRSRTMAMHDSNELAETAIVLFQQFRELEMLTAYARPFFSLFNPQTETTEVWTTKEDGSERSASHTVSFNQNKSLGKVYEAWKAKELFYVRDMKGQELLDYINYLLTIPHLKQEKMLQQLAVTPPDRLVVTDAFFNHGSVAIISFSPASDEQKEIMHRFAKVFEQTYTRFLDLKKSEAQAKESQVEAALERVRSRTLAMQKSDELAETAVVLFRQLIILGIEPNRLYINIIKDKDDEAEFWITDEDGSRISTAFSVHMNANPTFKKMYDGWKDQNKTMVIDMQGKELEEYFQYLSSINVPFKGGLSQNRRLQHIAYFSKGFIGMASPDEQPAETIQLLERFAAVFNLTFTRFNDLKIAEAHALQAEQDLIEIKAAKQKAEDTLAELQVTQKQLVQSEKMASLGELTAGIAHEIQNPLNFVNNFSEVSAELINELVDEVGKGNNEEVKAIARDIVQNLEKINHHGKRADAIVKNMLQHSRTSSGQKEMTDINALADEYLKLAYHGFRARDKSFNAKMETDFDNSIGKINIIPQDIGRALLNLINNAFYAAPLPPNGGFRETNRQHIPTIWLSTKKESNSVLIKVKDNGPGIPAAILDKIFQPFFTTKPTGQGTGLGLSLTYDIITKGHNGKLKVETYENEGTTFVIQLPL